MAGKEFPRHFLRSSASPSSNASLSGPATSPEKTVLHHNTPNTASAEGSLPQVDEMPKEKPSPQARQPWYRRWNPLSKHPVPPVTEQRAVSKEYEASWFSQLIFQWMTPIMGVGYRRPLEVNDIWTVNPERQIDLLSDRYNAALKRRLAEGNKHPLLWALHDTCKWEFWLGASCVLVSAICQVMSPFTLRYLIEFTTEAYTASKSGLEGPPMGRGLGLVFGIMGMQILQSLGTNQFIYRGFMVGAQVRSVLILAIFEKALRISARARPAIPEEALQKEKQAFFRRIFGRKKQNGMHDAQNPQRESSNEEEEVRWTNGRVMNMMSTDTSRIEQACGMFHLLWVSPMTITLTLALLLVNITYSALAGFSLLFLGIPLLTITMKKLIVRRKAISKVTDSRVSLTQETLQSVRFVKLDGWVDVFRDRLQGLRKREISMLQKLLAMRNVMNAVSVSLPIFAAMLSFIVYSLSNHELTSSIVFSSLSLFNCLRVPFNLLPVVIGQVTDGWAALGRLQDYVMAEDHKDDIAWDRDAEQAIEVSDASFQWEAKPDATTPQFQDTKTGAEAGPSSLQNLSISVGRSELVAVIGAIGSGKSSLLAALAGEMHRTAGTVTMGASRAFCPQYAWIQNTSIKENILFGKSMQHNWYNAVISACALEPDMAMLPAGDETEIGERGITLSGGQKQRLNIARAIYSKNDIILMDDPLSAVDAHVGRHIFEHAICRLMHGKCRILATHKLDILQRCDRVVWLDQGGVRAIDTFGRLMSEDIGFQQIVASTSQGKHDHLDDPKETKTTAEPRETTETTAQHTPLMQEEGLASEGVGWDIYATYIRASGSVWNGLLPIFLLIIAQASNIATSLWLTYWTEQEFSLSKSGYIGVYISLGLLQAFLMFMFPLSISVLTTIASRTMLKRAMTHILEAPMAFFDTTPLGRITNRFSKDVDTMDNTLPDAIRMYLYTLALVTSVFILLIVYFHYFGVALGVLLGLFLFAAAYYRASAREMKRHEAVFRSVVFARFSEALDGTSSIRVYGIRDHFTTSLRRAIDDMNSAYY